MTTKLIGLLLKQVIADFLSIEEVEDIKEMFKKMDTDNDGIVSIEELKVGLRNVGSQLAEPEVQMLIEAVSLHPFNFKPEVLLLKIHIYYSPFSSVPILLICCLV